VIRNCATWRTSLNSRLRGNQNKLAILRAWTYKTATFPNHKDNL
jgi:hypothetical protein